VPLRRAADARTVLNWASPVRKQLTVPQEACVHQALPVFASEGGIAQREVRAWILHVDHEHCVLGHGQVHVHPRRLVGELGM
jgi:hypothetical protein